MSTAFAACLLLLSSAAWQPGGHQVFDVHAYQDTGGVWRYDDPAHGITGESLDAGVGALFAAEAPGAVSVEVRFADHRFRGAQIRARFVALSAAGGAFYSVAGITFWLCKHLLDFFKQPPPEIYAEAIPLRA